jgi:hypothetical protein
MWIVVVVRMNTIDTAYVQWCVEITCEAIFQKSALMCVDKSEILPIPATYGGKCVDDIAILNEST